MKTVYIVGIGLGAETVTGEGMSAIRQADLLLGAPRMLEPFAHLGKPTAAEYAPDRVAGLLKRSNGKTFAMLVSGDVGFFSAAQGITQALDFCQVEWIPGLSSLNAFFARIKCPWQEAAVLSCHGRHSNLADTVRRNRLTFALTGGNIPTLAQTLMEAGWEDLTAYVGENLGMDSERVFCCPIRDLGQQKVGSLAVLLIENPAPDNRCLTGIPDEAFQRGSVPMTKAEVRSVILSKLALRPGDICADIGAGTGSVTVEMALSAWKGHVYGVERNPEGLDLIRTNCKHFHIGNVTPVPGHAPEALADLPPLAAAFIGGSGGEMRTIVDEILKKNPKARLVVSVIAIESLQAAMESFQAHGMDYDVVQIGISRTRTVGGLHLLMAQNPIFILSAGGRP